MRSPSPSTSWVTRIAWLTLRGDPGAPVRPLGPIYPSAVNELAVVVGPISAIAGVYVGHLLGAHREREASRREWGRAQLQSSMSALVDLLAEVEHCPVESSLPMDEVRTKHWQRSFAKLEAVYAGLRPLVLHPDEAIRKRTLVVLDRIYEPLVDVDFFVRTPNDMNREKAQTSWAKLQEEANDLADAVRAAFG